MRGGREGGEGRGREGMQMQMGVVCKWVRQCQRKKMSGLYEVLGRRLQAKEVVG